MGDGSEGIAVGRAGDFKHHFDDETLYSLDPVHGDDYLLRSHTDGLYVIGVTDAGVENAVWDLLHRLGYRQYFPGPTWEVVPSEPGLKIDVNAREHPDYLMRWIWYGYGAWGYNFHTYKDWSEKNRANIGMLINTGHIYHEIVHRNREVFDAHPEYLAMHDGERVSIDDWDMKFCTSNPDLRALVVQDSLDWLRRNPTEATISMEPSDGDRWCQCESCAAIGSASNQALLLANDVAEAIDAADMDRYVGIYAYHMHSVPPSIRVHPRVIVSVATSFIRGGYTIDQLLDGWSSQGATLGIREYYSVHPWDKDLPGAWRGAHLDYIAETLPKFHEYDARFMSVEASDNWGPKGLGYYIASRLMWDTRESVKVDELVQDFLDRAFADARQPMVEFYHLINGTERPLLSDDILGRMYRHLHDARQATSDPAVLERINHLILYTRYVELYRRYHHAAGDERQAAFADLLRYGYRIRKTSMIHSKGLWEDAPTRDSSIKLPEDAHYLVPEANNPWKVNESVTADEIDKYLRTGIARFILNAPETVEYSQDLRPASGLSTATDVSGTFSATRSTANYYTWVTPDKPPITFNVTGGLIYKTFGDVSINLYHIGEDGEESLMTTTTVPPDGESHARTLRPTKAGLHRIEVIDNGDATYVEWDPSTPVTIESSRRSSPEWLNVYSLCFYVPEGTSTVGGFSKGPGRLIDPAGRVVHEFTSVPDYFDVEVAPDQAGRIWRLDQCSGGHLLMTVPPYLSPLPSQLLIPREVADNSAAVVERVP